jgi:hypothetical protein
MKMNAFGIDTNTTAVTTNEVRTLSGMMTVQDAIKRAAEMTVASGVVLLVDEFVYRMQDPRESVAKILA